MIKVRDIVVKQKLCEDSFFNHSSYSIQRSIPARPRNCMVDEMSGIEIDNNKFASYMRDRKYHCLYAYTAWAVMAVVPSKNFMFQITSIKQPYALDRKIVEAGIATSEFRL